MASIIGIDLGSWSIKATVLQGGFNRYEMDGQYIKRVATEDAKPPSKADRLQTLQALLEEIPTEDSVQFGATFPVDHGSMRLVQLPFADKNQIAQTLEFEIEGLVPFDLDDMMLTHRIVSAGDEGSQVLACLTPTESLGSYLADLHRHGADPKSCTVDGDLLGVYGSTGSKAIIDMGHMRTIVTVTQGGKTVLSRAISFGGWHITSALAEEAAVPFSEAEQRKHNAQLSTQASAEWEDEQTTNTEPVPPVRNSPDDGAIIRTALAPLLASIRTTLIGYEDDSGTEIDGVLLTGGTSQLGGLVSMMRAELGVPTQCIQSGGESFHSLSSAAADRAAGIGGGEAMELRRGEYKYRGDLAGVRMLATFGLVAVVLLGIVGVGAFIYNLQSTRAEIADMDQQIAEVVASAFPDGEAPAAFDTPDDALLTLQTRTIETSERIALLGSIVSGEPPTITTLNQLSNALPEPSAVRIDVSELTVNENSINMKAETDGYDAAATIETSIQANQRFKQARKGDEKKGRNGIRFSVTISLKDETEEEEI